MGRKREERKRKWGKRRGREKHETWLLTTPTELHHISCEFSLSCKSQNKLSPITSLLYPCLSPWETYHDAGPRNRIPQKWLVLFIYSHFLLEGERWDGWHCLQGRNKGRTQTVDGGSSLARDTASEKPGSWVHHSLFRWKHNIILRRKWQKEKGPRASRARWPRQAQKSVLSKQDILSFLLFIVYPSCVLLLYLKKFFFFLDRPSQA